MRLIFLPILIVSVLSANGQALWRNFFSTNQNPRVTAVAGSNVTVQASTVGSDQRIFTINSVPPTNVAYSGFATNANFATNASNTTNFWGILNPTNIPSLNYISNNVGNGTNVTLWGSNNVIKADGLGTTITPTIWLTNGTAAALGAQQYSPTLALTGQGFRSDNSSTMPVSMAWTVIPIQGSSANPLPRLYLKRSVSNSAWADLNGATYFNDAGLTTYAVSGSAGVYSGSTVQVGSANDLVWESRSKIFSPANSDLQLVNNASTSFSRLFFGPLNALWPALKVETTNSPTLSVRTGADGNYASLLASNVISSGAHIATNGIQSYSSNNVVEVDALGTTITPALWLTNGTAAANNAQQNSPALVFCGNGWRSDQSVSKPAQFAIYATVSQANGYDPNPTLYFAQSRNGAALGQIGNIDYGGYASFSGYSSINYYVAGASSYFGFSGRSLIFSPANGDIQLMNNGGTSFSRLFFGPLNALWPALKVETTNSPTLSVRNGADTQYASLMASNITATGTVLATNIVANGTGTNIFAETLVTNNLVVSANLLASNVFCLSSSNGVVATNIYQPLGQFGYLAMANTNTVTVGSGNTYYVITNFSHYHTNGFTTIATNGFITNLTAGFYRISYHASALPGNSDTIEAEVFFNETGQEEGAVYGQYDNPARIRTLSGSFLDYIPANTGISLRINNKSGANNITLWRAGLTVGTP